jgi:hypothetical protein
LQLEDGSDTARIAESVTEYARLATCSSPYLDLFAVIC